MVAFLAGSVSTIDPCCSASLKTPPCFIESCNCAWTALLTAEMRQAKLGKIGKNRKISCFWHLSKIAQSPLQKAPILLSAFIYLPSDYTN